MSDMGDDFREWRKEKQKKKASNLQNSTQILSDAGYKFESNNGGIHLVVSTAKGKVDYWPSTGLFQSRNTADHGRGIKNLLSLLKFLGVSDANQTGK